MYVDLLLAYLGCFVLLTKVFFFFCVIKLFLLSKMMTMKTSAARRARCYPAGDRHHIIPNIGESSTINMLRAMNLVPGRDT